MNDILLFAARFLAIWFIAGPFVTLLHELGHAAAALALTDGKVQVWVGTRAKSPNVTLGRLHLAITPRPGFTGFYRHQDPASRRARAAILLAGPLTSLATAIAVFGLSYLTDAADSSIGESIVVVFGYAAVGQLLATAIPWRYPRGWGEYAGMASDGLRFLHVMRESGESTARSA